MPRARVDVLMPAYHADIAMYVEQIAGQFEQHFYDWVLTTVRLGEPVYLAPSDSAGRLTGEPVRTKEVYSDEMPLSEILDSCHPGRGMTYRGLWATRLACIAEVAAARVAGWYIENFPDRCAGIISRLAVEKGDASAARLLADALDGIEYAHTALRSRDYELLQKTAGMTMLDVQAKASYLARNIRGNQQAYQRWADKTKQELMDEANAIEMTEAEVKTKFFHGCTCEMYCQLRARVGEHGLSLLAWSKRLKCNYLLQQELSAPISAQIRRAAREMQAKMSPLAVRWELPALVKEGLVTEGWD